MGEHPHFVHVPISLGPLNLDITNEIVVMWLAAGLTLLVFGLAARRLAVSAVATDRFTNLVEAMLLFVRDNVAGEFLGEHTRRWLVFIGALFFFILFNNVLGKLPLHFYVVTPTSNISVTAALALLVFVVAQGVGLFKLGPVGYFKRKFLLPAPLWVQIPAIPIMFLVLLAEPFSLAVRLFANMLAGHMVMTMVTMGGLFLAAQHFLVAPLTVVPFALAVLLLAFELFIAFIQAFIFALLSALYLSECLEEHH
jgi:F-type H+-transporting ATPase subunit a